MLFCSCRSKVDVYADEYCNCLKKTHQNDVDSNYEKLRFAIRHCQYLMSQKDDYYLKLYYYSTYEQKKYDFIFYDTSQHLMDNEEYIRFINDYYDAIKKNCSCKNIAY